MRTYESARPAPPALSPHALHVHPLRPEGSTRFVRASGSPVHSSGCVAATTGGMVRLVHRVDKSDKRKGSTASDDDAHLLDDNGDTVALASHPVDDCVVTATHQQANNDNPCDASDDGESEPGPAVGREDNPHLSQRPRDSAERQRRQAKTKARQRARRKL